MNAKRGQSAPVFVSTAAGAYDAAAATPTIESDGIELPTPCARLLEPFAVQQIQARRHDD